MRNVLFTLTFFLCIWSSSAQNKLIYHPESVDSLLNWFQKGSPSTGLDDMLNLPANQIMEQLLKGQVKDAPTFVDEISRFTTKDSTSKNVYLLNEAYINRNNIRGILNEINLTDVSGEVYQRALEYFPDGYVPQRDYEVFFTTTGWEWGDAMTFQYINNNGMYSVSDEGTPAIIFNLTLVYTTYGETMDERMKALKEVLVHEIFHAIFSDYVATNWATNETEKVDYLTIYTMMNEGIAHYISNKDVFKKGYNKNIGLQKKESRAFLMLSDSTEVIFNESEKEKVRVEVLYAGTVGSYWDKYICISGLFMSYHIEQAFGTKGLKDCIANGPTYFIKQYLLARKANKKLPVLPSEISKMGK